MKSIFYWLVLIISIAVIVSSCAKSDDSKTASTDNTTSSSDDSSDNSTSTSDNSTSTSDNSSSSVSGVFVAVGQSGNIVRSTDNGSSWDNVTSSTGNWVWGVTFLQ